jgi:hyperosmotically inducible periplasmic protein
MAAPTAVPDPLSYSLLRVFRQGKSVGSSYIDTSILKKGNLMNTVHKSLLAVSSLAMLLSLGACDRMNSGSTVGQRVDSAANRTEQAARTAVDDTKRMGAAGVSKVDDATVTTKVNAALAADKDLSAVKIDVDTKDGVVTLTGPAPTADAKDKATTIAKNVKGVTSVNNQLTVKAG